MEDAYAVLIAPTQAQPNWRILKNLSFQRNEQGLGGTLEPAQEGGRLGGSISMHWWMLIPIAATILAALYGLFRWAAADPGIETERAKERFRAEQDWRGLHRSSIDPVPSRSRDRL